MPPKRKRTDVDPPAASTSRRTRSTTGSAAAQINSTRDSATSKSKSKTSTKSTASDASKKRTQDLVAQKNLEEPAEPASGSEEKPEPPRKRGKKKLLELPTPSKKKAISVETWSPYSKRSMEQLFATFADEEDPLVIGGEGFERLCTEAKISMEGVQPLLLAWLLEASDLGKFKIQEWLRGLNALQIDTLEKLSFALSEYETLLFSDMHYPKLHSTKKKHALEPYNRDENYWIYAADVPKAFLKFYMFVFLLAKAPQERNIDIEIAKAFWTTLLSEKYPIVNHLIEFINEKGSVRGVNKDLWGMTLDFCKTFNASLDGFEPDGAWPTLLDEFHAWEMAKQLPDTGMGCDQINT